MLKMYLDTDEADVQRNRGPADATWIFGEILPKTVSNVAVTLESASIPNVRYNVRSTNNTLDFYENAGAVLFQATITAGSYSGSTFAAALQTAMNAVGANTYVVTYSSTTFKINIVTTIPDTFRVLSTSTCLSLMGFNDAMSTFASGKTGDYLVNLLPTRYVDLVVNFNCASIALNKRSNILQRIYLSDVIGTVIFFQAQIPQKTVTTAESLRSISVRVYDDAGDLFTIDENHQISYNLIIEPLD